MPRTLTAAAVTGPVSGHGEGPVWHPSFGGVRFVDMHAGAILELVDGGPEVRRFSVDDTLAAAFRPCSDGSVVVAVERGLALFDADLRRTRTLPPLWHDPGVRMNDGGCDPAGGLFMGSMAKDESAGHGTLWWISPELESRPVVTGVGISNGLGFAPDGNRTYYNDSLTGGVDVFDFDPTRGLTGRRRLADVDPDLGVPDGLTVDAEGCVWTAVFGGGRVLRFTPDGTLDTVVEVDAAQTTACTFGGPALDVLYITTSQQGLDASARAAQPHAGALFAVDAGVTGLPTLEFARP